MESMFWRWPCHITCMHTARMVCSAASLTYLAAAQLGPTGWGHVNQGGRAGLAGPGQQLVMTCACWVHHPPQKKFLQGMARIPIVLLSRTWCNLYAMCMQQVCSSCKRCMGALATWCEAGGTCLYACSGHSVTESCCAFIAWGCSSELCVVSYRL
jgi:hypothetical protein